MGSKNINQSIELAKSIALLQQKQIGESALLKEQALIVYESLKPVNILKSTIKELISSPELKNGIVDLTIGVTTGIIAKKIVTGNSETILSQVVGSAVQMIVTKHAAENADQLMTLGKNLFNKLIKTDS